MDLKRKLARLTGVGGRPSGGAATNADAAAHGRADANRVTATAASPDLAVASLLVGSAPGASDMAATPAIASAPTDAGAWSADAAAAGILPTSARSQPAGPVDETVPDARGGPAGEVDETAPDVRSGPSGAFGQILPANGATDGAAAVAGALPDTTRTEAAADAVLAAGAAHAERLRRALQTLRPPTVSTAPAPPTALCAEARQTKHGLVHVNETLFPVDHRHGRAPVAAALDAPGELVAALALDPGLAGIDFTRMLLLDTETTGLAGGTGTLPFVVGLGWFEAGRLCVQQFVLRRPGEETPILRAFADRLASTSCLVSYNGKTFDWPLLRSRFVMNRLKPPAPPPHLDLLHCTRRVFRHRQGGAKLVHIEAEVLGHRRVGDVAGDQIPELYFRYLRTGQGHLLTPVLEHNAHDMVLLAALLGELVRQFRGGDADCDPRDQLGYASVAARAGDPARALAFARGAAERGDDVLGAEALALAAQISRREGDFASAVAALTRAAAVARGELLAKVHLELSKLHEHRLRDLPRALEHARHTLAAEGERSHRKRLIRLERRLETRKRGQATFWQK